MRRPVLYLVHASLGLVLLACAKRPEPTRTPAVPEPTGSAGRQTGELDRRARQVRDSSFRRPIYGPTWTLVQIGGVAPPSGSGGRPATLVLYSGTDRQANGYAGCNRWSSTYTLAGRDSIRFAPPVSTRMACADGMALETRFLRFVGETRRAAQRDSTLVLFDLAGDSARFVAR